MNTNGSDYVWVMLPNGTPQLLPKAHPPPPAPISPHSTPTPPSPQQQPMCMPPPCELQRSPSRYPAPCPEPVYIVKPDGTLHTVEGDVTHAQVLAAYPGYILVRQSGACAVRPKPAPGKKHLLQPGATYVLQKKCQFEETPKGEAWGARQASLDITQAPFPSSHSEKLPAHCQCHTCLASGLEVCICGSGRDWDQPSPDGSDIGLHSRTSSNLSSLSHVSSNSSISSGRSNFTLPRGDVPTPFSQGASTSPPPTATTASPGMCQRTLSGGCQGLLPVPSRQGAAPLCRGSSDKEKRNSETEAKTEAFGGVFKRMSFMTLGGRSPADAKR